MLYHICAAATLILQEEEVLRVFPGMNAEPMYPAKHSVLSILSYHFLTLIQLLYLS